MARTGTSEDTRLSGEPSAWFRRAELAELAELSAGYAVATLLPPRLDARVLGSGWRMLQPWRQARIRRLAERISTVLGPHAPDLDFTTLSEAYCQMSLEDRWGRCRGLRNGDWQPDVCFDGLDEIERGLEFGRGVVLWGMSFCGTLIPKIALRRSGFRVAHLSGTDHGAIPPVTKLGRHCLAPLHQRAENCFVDERVAIQSGRESFGYLLALRRVLARNLCVWISGERRRALRMIRTQLLGRQVGLPPGAPGLAWQTEAVLLSVRTIREGRMRYRLIVDPPIAPSRAAGREQYIEEAVAIFTRRIEKAVLRNPANWGWEDGLAKILAAAPQVASPRANAVQSVIPTSKLP